MAVKNVMVAVGTRPEAIKMAPVYKALMRRTQGNTILCSTGQHREMLDQVLQLFDMKPDISLNLMTPGQDLTTLTARVLTGMRDALREAKPDALLVHGDTTTCLGATLAAFYEHIPVGHVEAGLRTYNLEAPWPEEMNRRLVDPICNWCFAPTDMARQNLLNERVAEERIFVTGNTAIDSLQMIVEIINKNPPQIPELEGKLPAGKDVVLVTGHRRESFGDGFENICLGLRDIADKLNNVAIVYPVHLNPRVQEPVQRILGQHPNIHLLPPLSYMPFIWLMQRSSIIITDSGGIQEEAPSLGKPVLVMRDTTERPEAVAAGTAKLVGTDRNRIAGEAIKLLTDRAAYQAMAGARNPFGDGKAAQRIADILSRD